MLIDTAFCASCSPRAQYSKNHTSICHSSTRLRHNNKAQQLYYRRTRINFDPGSDYCRTDRLKSQRKHTASLLVISQHGNDITTRCQHGKEKHCWYFKFSLSSQLPDKDSVQTYPAKDFWEWKVWEKWLTTDSFMSHTKDIKMFSVIVSTLHF